MGYTKLVSAKKMIARVTGFRRSIAGLVVGVGVATLGACASEDVALTAPLPSSVGISASNAVGAGQPTAARSNDPLSAVLPNAAGACLVGVRISSGQYPTRPATVRFPRDLMSDQGRTTRFAYRGWAPGIAEPVLLVVCTIPDKPGAREFIAARFHAREMHDSALRAFATMLGVVGADDWGPGTTPHLMPGVGAVHIADGLASKFPKGRSRTTSPEGITTLEVCDPYAIIPEPGCEEPPPPGDGGGGAACDPTAIVPEPGCDETIPEEEPPPPSGGLEIAPILEPSHSVEVLACEGSTDYPHRSTTLGFVGRLNVKAHNRCPTAMPQFVSVSLLRQKCFLWVFCSWPAIASGSNSGVAAIITAMANTDCRWQVGWYVGRGRHETTFPNGVGRTSTVTRAVKIRCW